MNAGDFMILVMGLTMLATFVICVSVGGIVGLILSVRWAFKEYWR